MTNRFNHENLHVYHRALEFCAGANDIARIWESKHAVKDQLIRASESLIENLVDASAAYAGAKKAALAVSLGSTLECAACLDIAQIKGLLSQEQRAELKGQLLHVFRMLVGLRRSSIAQVVREPRPAYDGGKKDHVSGEGFHHEDLQVYRLSLDVVRWMSRCGLADILAVQAYRKLDAMATSIVLNVAEGNGRFSDADQARFLEQAHRSAARMAARLDLLERAGMPESIETQEPKGVLLSIARMTSAQIAELRQGGPGTK